MTIPAFPRRQFLQNGVQAALAIPFVFTSRKSRAQEAARPNVLVILTDDQGFGDLGCHGNPYLRTPHIDRFASQATEFTHFHVCPVCSPTRSSLLTGRYNYRTGIVDTYLGRSMMHPDEVTLAEVLGAAGYVTSIFGKWHLGDNYPLRACDHGFQESLVCKGGGLTQPSDPPGNTYFDPMLLHNGEFNKYSGYCTDIFTNAAIEFITAHHDQPFFAWLSTNAPHTPLQVDDRLVQPFLDIGLDETTARVYAMEKNLDDNIGRLFSTIESLGLTSNTLIVFLSDNGPQQPRFNAGLRGLKGQVYDGGIRVPCFLRWDPLTQAGSQIDSPAAHIDLFPTVLEACGVPLPGGRILDGYSLLPLLRHEAVPWRDRSLFFQWHRGDQPEPYRNCAARNDQYKLVNGRELYDLLEDPRERFDVAAGHPDVVARLRRDYEAWLDAVSSTRGYNPPRIYLGAPEENPVILTRQDWRGPKAGWGENSLGYWEVFVAQEAIYEVRLLFKPTISPVQCRLRLGPVDLSRTLRAGTQECTFTSLRFPRGDARLEAEIVRSDAMVGVNYVHVTRVS